MWYPPRVLSSLITQDELCCRVARFVDGFDEAAMIIGNAPMLELYTTLFQLEHDVAGAQVR
jgi:hypothetical protein